MGSHFVAEINYLAFGVQKVEYHIQLYAALHNLLQAKTGTNVATSIASIDRYIKQHSYYDSSKHEREDTAYGPHYYTLPTYTRNAIDHPDSTRRYNEEDLVVSIDLLRQYLNRSTACMK